MLHEVLNRARLGAATSRVNKQLVMICFLVLFLIILVFLFLVVVLLIVLKGSLA